MWNRPEDAPDADIAKLMDDYRSDVLDRVQKLVNPEVVFKAPAKPGEHPLATLLYRKFKAGSAIMTKDEAWKIANELDRLWNVEGARE